MNCTRSLWGLETYAGDFVMISALRQTNPVMQDEGRIHQVLGVYSANIKIVYRLSMVEQD